MTRLTDFPQPRHARSPRNFQMPEEKLVSTPLVYILAIAGLLLTVVPAICSCPPTLIRTMLSMCAVTGCLTYIWIRTNELKNMNDKTIGAFCLSIVVFGFDIIYLIALIALAIR